MASAGKHPDVIRAQVELATLEDVLKSLRQLREPLSAKLNAVLNRKSLELLPWPQKQAFKQVQIGRREIIAMLVETNPELAALTHEVQAARYAVELAKKQFWPDIGVGVDWIQTDGALASGTRDSGKNPVMLMFSMNLPIWRDKYKAAERQAKANVSKIAHLKVEKENMLLAKSQQVLYDFEDGNRKVKLYGDVLVPKAEELLQASEPAYQGGTVDFLSLIDAQRTLLKFELQLQRALTDSQQSLAELEMLIGTELPTINNESVPK